MPEKVFLSYSRRDREYTRRLRDHLAAAGFDVWFDEEIDYSNRWWQAIVEQIRATDAVVLVMTPALDDSEFVVKEVLLARREHKPIFPLLVDGPGFPLVIDIQHVDVTPGRMPPADFLESIRRRRRPAVDPGRSEMALEAIVREFEKQEEILAAADRAVRARRADVRLHTARAQANNVLLRPAEALAAAEAALRLDPGCRAALIEKAEALTELDDDAEALAVIEELRRHEPGSARLMAMHAIAVAANDLAESLLLSERALTIQPGQPDALLARSLALAMSDRPDEAIALADQFIAAKPGLPLGYVTRAFCFVLRHDVEPAAALLDGLSLICPDSAQVRGLHATVLQATNPERAEAEARRAIELGPRLISGYGTLASLLVDDGRPDEAIAVLADAEAVMPWPHERQHAEFFGAKALLLAAHDRRTEARAAAAHGRELLPTAPTPLLAEAVLALLDGAEEAARHALDRALDRGLAVLARTVDEEAIRFVEAGRPAEALVLDEALARHGHGSPARHLRRADCLLALHRPAEAVVALRGAELSIPEEDPVERAGVASRLGAQLRELGRSREAAAAFERAARLDPTDPGPVLGLVLLALDEADVDRATSLAATLRTLDLDRRAADAIVVAGFANAADAPALALDLLTPLTTFGDDEFEAARQEATANGRLDRFGPALTALRRAERLSPPDWLPTILQWQGEVLIRLRRFADAGPVLRRAADLDADRPGPLLSLAFLAALRDDPATAERLSVRGLARDTDGSWRQEATNLAQRLLAEGHPGPALALADRLLDVGWHGRELLGVRMVSLQRLARPAEAADAAQQLAELVPTDVQVQVTAAGWLLEVGRAEAALRCARRATANAPRDAGGYFVQARALTALGRTAEGDAVHERGLALAKQAG